MFGRVKRLEFDEEERKRIKLEDMQNQIYLLNGNDDGDDIGEQVYRNNLVILQICTETLQIYY